LNLQNKPPGEESKQVGLIQMTKKILNTLRDFMKLCESTMRRLVIQMVGNET